MSRGVLQCMCTTGNVMASGHGRMYLYEWYETRGWLQGNSVFRQSKGGCLSSCQRPNWVHKDFLGSFVGTERGDVPCLGLYVCMFCMWFTIYVIQVGVYDH